MNSKMSIARKAVVVMTLLGGVAACATGASPGAMRTSAASAEPTGPGNVLPLSQTFTSTLYGYSIRYPITFEARSATVALQGAAAPLIDSQVVDQLTSTTGGLVVLAAATLPSGVDSLDEWTASTARGFCGEPTTSEPVTLGGEPATLGTFASCAGMFHQWATMVRDGQGYHVVWARPRGSEAADRALFMAMLATFDFGPADASASEPPASTTAGLRPLEPGDLVPDALLGTWYHAAPAFLWVLRAGDPACLELPRTSQDCAIWQRLDGRRLETGILTVVDGRLSLQWVQGGCSTTSVYSFGIPVDRLTLRLVSGCQSGDFALTRAGTGDAPSAPPKPGT
jgi:hypothetical protein